MHRCITLAMQGGSAVAPNPMVGAILVHNDNIIGEGYHQKYGQAHAEVNCIQAVAKEHIHLIPESILYVSLEPCAHMGKTPPCADLIIKNKIPKVVIGCRDPFKEVNGKGIEKLKAAGIEVIYGVLEGECAALNKRFFCFHSLQRPYIILKWAQTANGIMGNNNGTRLLISNEYSNRLLHKWRSEEAAIMIGTNTALVDNPLLTTRLWKGNNPVRLLIDRNLRLPLTLNVFDGNVRSIVFNEVKQEEKDNILYYRIKQETSLVSQINKVLYHLNIQSVLVEGGAALLQSFINDGEYDEVRVITSNSVKIAQGICAPQIKNVELMQQIQLNADSICFYKKQ